MIFKYIKIVERIAAHVDLRDMFVFGGLALIALGLWDIYWPLAPVVVGTVLVWLGVRR